MIDKFIKLVKSQVSFHAYAAEKSNNSDQRLKQQSLKNEFSELLEVLLLIQEAIQKYSLSSIKDLLDLLERPNILLPQNNDRSPDITPEDLDGLPPEILEKLELSESDKYEFQIVNIIRKVGGTASLRKIMLELYKQSGDMPDKQTLNNKLYRMTMKKTLFRSSMGKGYYSTFDDGSSQNNDDE